MNWFMVGDTRVTSIKRHGSVLRQVYYTI